jgi:hypothetical protein
VMNKSFAYVNKSSTTEAVKMSTATISPEQVQDEISRALRQLASPVLAGDSVKECIRRASRRTGVPYGQVRRAWYKSWRSIPAYVADTIRIKAAEHERAARRNMVRAIAAMQTTDPAAYRDCIAHLGECLLPDDRAGGDNSRVG